MAKISDQAYGVGMPEIWYNIGGTMLADRYVGGRWVVIELPWNTHCDSEPEDTSFPDVDPIEETAADGSLYFLDRGCRGEFPLTIDPCTKELYQSLCALRGYVAQNPKNWLLFRRHSDKDEAYRVKWRGPLRDPWSHGNAAAGYAVSFTLIGVDNLDSAEPDNEIVSHYCDSAIVYDPTDEGVHSYAETGCPWEFGVYRDGEIPPQWLTTGTTVVDRLRINNKPAAGLSCTGTERSILNYVTPANGYMTAQILVNNGVGGLIWRSNVGMTNYYAIRVDPVANTIAIYRNTTLLVSFASPVALAVDTWFDFKIHFNGSLHRVWVKTPMMADYLYVGSTTDANYTTGYCGQLSVGVGSVMLGCYHDVYSASFVRAELDSTTLAYAAYYTGQPKFIYPWSA
ncbi:MAG: hypothetical protein PHE17_19215 [Thiothrix sp.]|jgi:hypothetical protein|uniref:hypothetical protein n=1 Tax=Thiothrix sp. TaxID=1032 RepID=UPI002609B3DF|nr:hypothetical protein [Thiothrix sp.]MDD5395157.1 hypothetical protein [Thiothrix sp.]